MHQPFLPPHDSRTQKWKVEAITKKLLGDSVDPYLSAWLAYRDSSIMRMSGKLQESESALHRFLQYAAMASPEELERTPRFNAQRGDLVVSFSENLVRRGKLAEAKAELMEWKPLGTECSTLEKITTRARDITLGKVLRYQGLFSDTLNLLEGVLRDSFFDDYFEGTGWYRVLLSGMSNLYCEMGQPCDAERLFLQELNTMRERGTQEIATGRRLRMSLADSYLQRDMYTEAEGLLKDLQLATMSSGGPEYTADVNIFRISVSLARVSHKRCCWEEALVRWRHALSTLDRLKLSGGFNAGIVRCSIAHALFMKGQRLESANVLEEARKNLASEPRTFWIPLFNSEWHDFITDALEQV